MHPLIRRCGTGDRKESYAGVDDSEKNRGVDAAGTSLRNR